MVGGGVSWLSGAVICLEWSGRWYEVVTHEIVGKLYWRSDCGGWRGSGGFVCRMDIGISNGQMRVFGLLISVIPVFCHLI